MLNKRGNRPYGKRGPRPLTTRSHLTTRIPAHNGSLRDTEGSLLPIPSYLIPSLSLCAFLSLLCYLFLFLFVSLSYVLFLIIVFFLFFISLFLFLSLSLILFLILSLIPIPCPSSPSPLFRSLKTRLILLSAPWGRRRSSVHCSQEATTPQEAR